MSFKFNFNPKSIFSGILSFVYDVSARIIYLLEVLRMKATRLDLKVDQEADTLTVSTIKNGGVVGITTKDHQGTKGTIIVTANFQGVEKFLLDVITIAGKALTSKGGDSESRRTVEMDRSPSDQPNESEIGRNQTKIEKGGE